MTDVLVRSEPLTYEEGGPNSFFRDIGQHALRDARATDRLERHQREMDVELRLAGRGATSVVGAGGEFDPPLWLIDRFKTAARAGRPFADLLNPLPLPRGISSVNIPKFAIPSILGGETGVQATDADAVTQLDPTTANTSSPVVTIAGQMDASQQLFDLSPVGGGFDAAAYLELNRDYNVKLEGQLLTGTGINGQLTGLANYTIPAANTVSGTGITAISGLWPVLGQAAAAIGNNRGLAPEFWLMAPRRWFWIASSVDNSNRPVASPGGGTFHMEGLAPVAGGQAPFGPIDGLPVYVDGAIPAGTTADNVYCVRGSDMFLFESDAKVRTSVNATAGTLQVRMSLHRYVAFVGNTYTSGLAVVTALPQPSNF